MTQSNFSPTEKVSTEKVDTRREFWGTIVLAVISILLAAYFLNMLFRQPKTPVIYSGIAVFLSAATASAISLFFTVRNRQSLGIRILFFAINLLGIIVIGLVQGRAPTSSFTILMLSAMIIAWLLPKHLTRSYSMMAAIAFMLMWVIEWINPPWRIQVVVAAVGPIAGIVFILFLLAFAIRQAWARISLRWKIGGIVAILLLGIVAVGYTGYVGLQSLRYQLSNIYDFMLVPIVSINNADAALADAQIKLENLDEVKDTEIAAYIDAVNADNKLTQDIVTRYDTEWVTTTSPEFTAALRQGGKLDLQYQEVAALNRFHKAFNLYLYASQQYEQSVQAGGSDQESSLSATQNLQEARQALQELISINDQFAGFSNTQAQSAFRSALVRGMIVLGLSMLIGIIVSYWVVASILSRLEDLTQFAAEVQKGNLAQRITVLWNDEITALGNSFNDMTSQLQGSFATLEQRVAARTHNLELAAAVGRAVSEVRTLDVMLKDACELILKEFDLYYVQVYLSDPSGSTLKLEAGTGSVGHQLTERGHSLPLNTGSINGRAAVEKRSVVISDTAESATFRPNALLPKTRGEMAVPLIVAGKVVGVLDMQSSKPSVLNAEILPAFEALAGQLAVAVQNANLLAEAEESRAEVEKQARRLVHQGWTEHLDAIHKPEQIGYVFDRQEVTPLVEAEDSQIQNGNKAVSAPIAVAGEALGSLVVEMDSENEQVSELVNVVARQVAQQIENLRLIESAERYRNEAEQAARRLTRESWQEYLTAHEDKQLAYMYDLQEVKKLEGTNSVMPFSTAIPLKVGDEPVGTLAIENVTSSDTDAIELANAVADRLSKHIESLRLLENAEESRAEIQQSQERLSEALDIAKLGNWEYNVEKDLFTFNDNFYSVFHTNVKEIGSYYMSSGEYAQRFVHPEDVPLVGGEIGKALNSTDRNYTTELEHRVLFVDGGVGYISVSVHVDRDEQGKIARFYGANQDITERKQAEESLRARESQLSEALAETQSLYRINEAISGKMELKTIYHTVAQLTCNEMGFSGSWIGVYEPKDDSLHGVAGVNIPEERISASLPLSQSTPATLAARLRQFVTVNDPRQDERMQDLPEDVRAFMGKALSVPVMAGDELLGTIAVTRPENAADIGVREERMLQAVALQLAIVMQRVNLFEQLQKQAKRESMLNIINQKIQSATSVEAVLQIAARELGHALGAPMTIAQLSMKDKSS